jgi:hypothetical protein
MSGNEAQEQVQASNGLRGVTIGSGAAKAALIVIEGKKEGKNIVMQKITLNNGERSSEALPEGSVFSGTFEGVATTPAANGFEARSYMLVRGEDSSLTKIKLGFALSRDLELAREAGLEEGDAVEVVFNGTIKTKSGRTVNSYTISI